MLKFLVHINDGWLWCKDSGGSETNNGRPILIPTEKLQITQKE